MRGKVRGGCSVWAGGPSLLASLSSLPPLLESPHLASPRHIRVQPRHLAELGVSPCIPPQFSPRGCRAVDGSGCRERGGALAAKEAPPLLSPLVPPPSACPLLQPRLPNAPDPAAPSTRTAPGAAPCLLAAALPDAQLPFPARAAAHCALVSKCQPEVS
eukprot:21617-Rhodomonas_salina.1